MFTCKLSLTAAMSDLMYVCMLSAAMTSLDPEQVGILGNAGGFLLQADEAGQAAVTVVLRSLQDLERLVKEASGKDVRDGYVSRIHNQESVGQACRDSSCSVGTVE